MARGQTARLWARAAKAAGAGSSVPEWQWVEDLTCPAAQAAETVGPTIVRTLQCATAPTSTNP